MISSNRKQRYAAIFGCGLLIAIALACVTVPTKSSSTPEKIVQKSWGLMQEVGQYDFSTTVEQVTYPAPALANVGQSSTKDIYQVSGQADLNNRSLLVRLFKNQGSLLNPSDGVEIRIQDDKATGRAIGAANWQPLDNYTTSSFTFGDNGSSYLTSAKNVQEQGSRTIEIPDQNDGSTTISVTGYRFDVDSDEYAAWMRDQMVQELQRSGKLPVGMELSVSDQYRKMVASGELWVSPEGLPVRLIVTMKMPPEKNGDHIEAKITTDYFNHQTQNLMASRPFPDRIIGALGIPTSGKAAQEFAMQVGLFAGCVLLLAAMAIFSDKKFVYGAVAILVILSMLISPIWQGNKASVFAKGIQERNSTAAKADQQAQEAPVIEWDAHTSPLDKIQNHTSANQPAQPEVLDESPIKISSLGDIFPSLQMSETGENDVDSDQDGLTDAFESQHDISILNPNLADTDSDGLDDNVELMLNLAPGNKDTDGDGIWDDDEVRPFYASDKDWYTNPEERDTDLDGQLDGIECPERTNGTITGLCRDTDADGTPDVFDTDDDNDGIPTVYDDSPYVVSNLVYSVNNPFKLILANLDAQPVFVNYQITPTNEKHLTYALNVLDWPSGDTDGQIQRISDTKFSDQMTPSQVTADPRTQFGDMRLIPMLEIKFTGDSYPFPLSRTVSVDVSGDSYTGKFDFSSIDGDPGKTRVELTEGAISSQVLKLGQGTCDEFTFVSSLGLHAVSDSIVVNQSLGNLVNGNYVLYLTDSSNSATSTCSSIPAVAHGKMTEYVIDSSTLQAYGGAARDDGIGNVLVYQPLSVVYDETGGKPIAFSAKVPYTNIHNGFASSQQEIRAIWLLNMLTDECKPVPASYNESASGTWCSDSIPARWNTNVSQVVHTYNEDFKLAGLSVIEDHGVNMAVIFENPTTDPEPNYDDPLWGMSSGLEQTFLVGRSADNETLDITVDEIQRRFDPDHNASITDVNSLWGFDKDTFRVVKYSYNTEDSIVQTIGDQVTDIFDTYFEPVPEGSRPTIANLLFAREITRRATAIGESSASCTAAGCSVDFTGLDVYTQAMINWAPYQRQENRWTPYALNDYIDHLEAHLRSLDSYQPEDNSTDAKDYVDGEVAMAKIYYQNMYSGIAMLVAMNGKPLLNTPQVVNDEDIYTDFYRNNLKGQIITKIIKFVVGRILAGLETVPHLLFTVVFGTKTDTANGLLTALGKGDVNNPTFLTKYLTTTMRKAAAGVAVFVMVAAIAVSAILYLNGPDSPTGKLAGRIMFTLFGACAVLLAGAALQSAINTVKCVANSAKAAAVVGAVIGVLITWGVFFYTWGASGVSIGSIAFNNMLAEAIASTIMIVLMAALCFTGVGAIIVAVIGLIDALIMTICAAAGANDLEEDHWARQYVCIGISGWVTKIIKWALYSNTYLIDYENGDRLEFNEVNQDLQNVNIGMSYGNHMKISIGVKNTITKSDIPIDWKAAAYWWQFSDSNAKSSTFAYKLQTSENDIHGSLSRDTMSGSWVSVGDSKWEQQFTAGTDGFSVAVPQAGINQDPTVYFSEGSALPVQECWALYIPIITPVPIPICYIRTEKATVSSEISDSLTVDSFPATLDGFYTLIADETNAAGAKLSWGQTGTKKFPMLKDADGDSLMSKAFTGGNDPDDTLFDTDNDGLSDFYEIANGSDPRKVDTDDDGLDDSFEILYRTSITRKDTDGDGLTDFEEIMGWLFTYDFTSIGAPLETMVYPDPLMPDTDFDGVTDYLEKVYGFNPRVAQNSDVLDYELTMREQDAPVMMLRLNEETGAQVFEDSSNFSFAASCTAEECPLSGIDGRYAGGVRFDGTDLLHLPTSAKTISLGGSHPFTVVGWVNSTSGGTLISKWSDQAGSQQDVRLEITGDQHLQLMSSLTTVTSSAAIPAGEWTFIVASFDGAKATLWIDGSTSEVYNFSTASPASGSTPVEIMVGAYQGASGPEGYFNGAMDEITLFDHAMSIEDLSTRWKTGRYNFNDTFVRPGEEVVYQSKVTNLLNSRFAYGLLTTLIDKASAIVDWASKLIPTTFVLYPDNPVVTGVNTVVIPTRLQIEPNHTISEDVTITQTAAAQIVDRRAESNLAELWLALDEASGSTFVDQSGNMPPRDSVCTSNCPTSNQAGILNKSILFRSGQSNRLNLPNLSTLNLLNRGYTVSLWVKPVNTSTSGARIPLLDSDSDQLSITLVRQSDGSFLPEVLVNGASKVSTSWRTMNASVWSHLVVEYFSGDNTFKVYINGGQIVSTTATTLTSSSNLWLGGSNAPTDFYVDDLRIFSRPLSVTDINRLAERPVLALNMDNSTFSDSSVYSQSVTNPHNWPTLSSTSVRGSSLYPNTSSSIGYVRVNGNSLLDMSDGSFTFSVWVYPTSQGNSTWQGIFGDRESWGQNSSYPSLERLGSKLRFGFGDGSSFQLHTSGDILPQSRWSLVTVTFAPSLLESGQYIFKLYIDYELKESRNFSTKPVSHNSFYVGTTSKSYTTTLYRLNMDNEHDAGDNAEVYIEEYVNGGYTGDPMGETSMGDGDHHDINYSKTLSNYENVSYTVWEEDSTSADDNCGSFSRHWYDLPDGSVQSIGLSDGFDGSLTFQMTKPSIQFYGYIDEMQVYRYAIDSEQVYDLFYAIPVTARLPLDDRPSSTYFENNAVIGTQDDGTCAGENCPAAGTIGLINQAVRFDGKDDVITVDNISTKSNYMVSLWLNSTCENCGAYTLKNGTSVYHQLYLKSGNICSLAGSTEMCSQGGTVTDGQWHFIVYANDGSTANLWLDGSRVNTLGGTGAVSSPGTTALLGYASAAGNDTLNGQLDDVRVFRYVQDDSVIAAIKQRAPLFLAHLDEPDGSSIFDDSTPNDFQFICSDTACPTGGFEGRLRQAVEFNQNADVLTLSQQQLSSTATAFSASLWIYPTENKSAAQSIFTINNGANSQPRYAISIAPDSMYLTVQNTQNIPVNSIPQSNVELIKNTWNMITLVVERNASNTGENYYLYINGYLDSSWTSTVMNTGLGKVTLGNGANFTGLQRGPYTGKIDEVTVYEYAVNEIDIREIFAYQMGQVEETSSLTMTIDAEQPQVNLVSYNPDFPYMDENDRVLHVEATDATSGIGMVEMQVEHVDADPQLSVAPVCQDAPGGTAFCPTLKPEFGDGKYTLTFRAVDQVGNESQNPPTRYEFFVDNTPPTIFDNLTDGALYNAEPHLSLENTWFLHMQGQVLDPTLGEGTPGSGLDQSSMKITVFSENGEIAGSGVQEPELTPATNGYNWRLDYLFPETEPTGALTVVIEAKDRVGNLASKTINILLDASAPNAQMESNQVLESGPESLLSAATLDSKLISGGTVDGSVNDEPKDGIPYLTPNGKFASSGVSRVEAAFEPSLGVSYLFNEPYPSGLLAWLPLDNSKLPEDNTGNPNEELPERYFMDISPAQFAGVCSGENCPINGETGHKSGSIYFDGQEKFINLGSNVDLANRSFSALIWARRDAAGHSDPFIWQGPLSIAGQRFLFGLDYEDHLVCGFGGTDLLSAETYPDTAWHAYACTYDQSTGKRTLYRDGQEVASDTASQVPQMNEDLLLGYAPVGSFAGSLDELMIFDHVLAADEIREAYTGYQAVYHLAVHEKFLANGDSVSEDSGFYQNSTLHTGASDPTNKVTAGAVGSYALHFDGNDLLAVDPAFSLSLDRGAFTQTAWVKPEGASGIEGIISELDENPEQRNPSIYLTQDYGLVAGFGDFYDWNEFVTTNNVVQPDTWNFITARFDGQVYSLFVNGKEVAYTLSMQGKKPYFADRFNIGEQFMGDIDDVKVFTRALTDLEITAMAHAGWRTAELDSTETGQNWSSALLPGLEGPYQVDVRGWDSFGHFGTNWSVDHQWSGVIDTLAPRFLFERTMDPDDPYLAHYTFSVEDTLLDESSIHQNLCDEITVEREHFNSSWYLATGVPPNTTLYRLSGNCTGDIRTTETTGFYACDLAGNCVMKEYPPMYDKRIYMPLTMGGNPSVPSLTPAMPAPLSHDQVDQVMQWPTLNDVAKQVEGGQAPQVDLLTSELTPADARSIFHTNLQGMVSDDGVIASVQVEILQNDSVLYSTQASVYGELWNAVWVYPPGSQPANGMYTVRVTATDASGQQAQVEREIFVHLLP